MLERDLRDGNLDNGADWRLDSFHAVQIVAIAVGTRIEAATTSLAAVNSVVRASLVV